METLRITQKQKVTRENLSEEPKQLAPGNKQE